MFERVDCNTVEVFITNSASIDPKSPQIAGILSCDRKKRLSRLMNEKSQRESCAAELLLCYALRDRFIPPLQIQRTEKDKPYISGCDLHFSLSHSDGFAVCAVSDIAVGADIEKKRELTANVAHRICGDEYNPDRAIEAWSIKEAFLKLTGEGLGGKYSLGQIHISDNTVCAEGRSAFLHTTIIDEMYLSVCAFSDFELKIKTLSVDELLTAFDAHLSNIT